RRWRASNHHANPPPARPRRATDRSGNAWSNATTARARMYSGNSKICMLSKADFADAILKVFCPTEDFDFDAHEVNGKIAPINFGKANRVLLRGDDGFGELLFAAVDDFDDFELGESMMIGEFARVH